MKLVHTCLISLIALVVIITLAQFWAPIQDAYGVSHPTCPEMMISAVNIDDEPHTRWLGYLFGMGVMAVLGTMILIGVRKKGRTSLLSQDVYIGLVCYVIAYSGMVISHWHYNTIDDSNFFASIPIPTAWMILGVWFVPLIITITFIRRYDNSVISEEEITEFRKYLSQRSKP